MANPPFRYSGVGGHPGHDGGDRPRFTLKYLLEPVEVGTPLLPLGTCLAVQNSGLDAVNQILVDPNDRNLAPRAAPRLGAGELLGLCPLDDVEAYAATRMIFVDWSDRVGRQNTTWLRLPQVPRGISALLKLRRNS